MNFKLSPEFKEYIFTKGITYNENTDGFVFQPTGEPTLVKVLYDAMSIEHNHNLGKTTIKYYKNKKCLGSYEHSAAVFAGDTLTFTYLDGQHHLTLT